MDYIDNKQFLQIIKDYKERKKSNPKEKIPEEAGKMLLLMSQKMRH